MINGSLKSGDYHKINDDNKSTSDGEDSKCVKKKRKLINNNNQQINDYVNTATKKPRVIWTPELHHKFVAAVNQFGNSKAVPKKILELMNVPGLTRENVASHLQKYRQYQKRVEQNSHQQNGHTMNFMSSKEQCFQRHNIQAQVIATSSLQVRGYPSQNDLYGRETLTHRKHVSNVNEVDHQMLSFHHAQPHQTIGQIANATDINLAIVEHVEGSNVIYHPLASYAYSKIDSKIHVVETPYNLSTFSMEDNLKKEGQQSANYAYENALDLGYNNDASLYIEQLDHNAYGCS
ncbi:uncharacterized protein LOC141589763 [Silene latifolia]|uniref:uncharacterized protein LOC141589763 n=1 Tax=Silene latifolia TaxID=37657 RepID=UPI003D770DE5